MSLYDIADKVAWVLLIGIAWAGICYVILRVLGLTSLVETNDRTFRIH